MTKGACSILFLFLLIFVSLSPDLMAQTAPTPTDYRLQPKQIDEDFNISGELSHSAWKKAPSIFIRHEVQPDDQNMAPVQTEVKVLYSSSHIYIAFIAHDPAPENIRAHITDRDNSFNDDFVGVFLDPFQNNQQAYEFFINPLGIQMDGMRTGNNEDMNFDALWYSDGKITDFGYTAVMKIPFKSLNFPKREVQNWSVQFLRNYPRSSRYQYAWTDVDLDDACLLCQNGQLVNLRQVKSSNTVELLPYAMSYQTSSINELDDPRSGLNHGPLEARIGGSVSYSPSSTLSLNAVVNPDFSQVETDAVQISANETFALYYPEKRPFFMKGASLFSTSEDLFYSRMINRPLAAGKITQKTSNYTFAFLTAYDRNAPFIIPGLYGSRLVRSNVNAYNNVLRGKYNFGAESYIGGLITTRNQQQGYNYVGSIDWNFRLADHYYLGGQLGYSSTRELDNLALSDDPRTFGNSRYDAAFNGQQYGGTLIKANFSRHAEYYNFSFGYSSFSPTFQTQSGFINRIDRRQFDVNQSISYYPNTAWLTHGSLNISSAWRYDFDNQFQERYIFVRLTNNFAGQTQLTVSYLPLNDERFRGAYFTEMHRLGLDLNTNAWDVLSLGAHIETGRYIYRTGNPTIGHGYNISASATLQPTSQFEMSLDYSYSTLSSLDDSQNFYRGDVFRLNSQFNFSKKLFARLIAQYDSFSEQIQFYPLVYYKANPFTKFYIGMTDNLSWYDQVNGFQGYKEIQRQFFVKFQYLIRS